MENSSDASLGENIKKIYFNSVSLSSNKIIKILATNNGDSIPTYFYTGTRNTGDYDLIFANGSSKSSMAIQSDAPVFVNTLVTSRSYEDCKEWDSEYWEFYKKRLGEKQLDFSSSDHSPKKYTIPVDEIESGECYVVIAHFADGSTAMSEVMQK